MGASLDLVIDLKECCFVLMIPFGSECGYVFF